MQLADIHCHILPGIDDGAKTPDQSIDMINLAYKQGVRLFFATVHASPMFSHYSPEELRQRFEEFKELAEKEIGSDVNLFLGQEIFFQQDVPELLAEGKLMTLAGSNYVLVEFFPQERYSTIRKAVREIVLRGRKPILAHVERYEALDELERVEEIISDGALLQVNYGSIRKNPFDSRSTFCKKLLVNGYVHFLGTDMHDTAHRKPDTAQCIKWMEHHLEQKYVEDLCYQNAMRLVRGERIDGSRNGGY